MMPVQALQKLSDKRDYRCCDNKRKHPLDKGKFAAKCDFNFLDVTLGSSFEFFDITLDTSNIALGGKPIVNKICLLIGQNFGLRFRHSCFGQAFDEFMGIESNSTHAPDIGRVATKRNKLTTTANQGNVSAQIEKRSAGIDVPSVHRRTTNRASFKAARFSYGRMRRSTFGCAVPVGGNVNPVTSGHPVIDVSSGRDNPNHRRPAMAHDLQAESAFTQLTYQNSLIEQRTTDAYLNATAMCQAVGKLYADYRRLSSTAEYLNALSGDMGIPISELVSVKKGGASNHQGTWVHPKVAIHLAQWLSPEFAVWCSNVIFDYMTGVLEPAPDTLPFSMDELTDEARALLQMADEVYAAAGRMKHQASRLFSKAQHNRAFAPKPIPAPNRETLVRAHVRKLPKREGV